jgi:hypothetical protein
MLNERSGLPKDEEPISQQAQSRRAIRLRQRKLVHQKDTPPSYRPRFISIPSRTNGKEKGNRAGGLEGRRNLPQKEAKTGLQVTRRAPRRRRYGAKL